MCLYLHPWHSAPTQASELHVDPGYGNFQTPWGPDDDGPKREPPTAAEGKAKVGRFLKPLGFVGPASAPQ
jgi:hypothetical protein